MVFPFFKYKRAEHLDYFMLITSKFLMLEYLSAHIPNLLNFYGNPNQNVQTREIHFYLIQFLHKNLEIPLSF